MKLLRREKYTIFENEEWKENRRRGENNSNGTEKRKREMDYGRDYSDE